MKKRISQEAEKAIVRWAIISCVGMLWIACIGWYGGVMAWHNLNPSPFYFLWAIPGFGLCTIGILMLKKANKHGKKT